MYPRVIFMFLISINKLLREINWFKNNLKKEPVLLNFLDLVSLGTVCDVVPLVGLNRAIVKQGLKILRSKKNLGLKTLLDICKIEANPSIYHLGYVLGPRINAGGRVGKCSHGANLLLNSNPKDSASHPGGVWTLPPSLRLKDKDREKYLEIGESDRMTLLFKKS